VLTAQQVVEPPREEPRRSKSSTAANLVGFSNSLLYSYQVGWQQLGMPLSNVLFARIREFYFAFEVRTRKLLQVAACPSIRIDQHARIEN